MNTDPIGMSILFPLILPLLMMKLHAQEWHVLHKSSDLKLGEGLIIENKDSECPTKLILDFFLKKFVYIGSPESRLPISVTFVNLPVGQ